MKQRICFRETEPFVRVAADMVIKKDKKSQLVCASDHRLFYVKAGSAIVTLSGEQRHIYAGSAMYFLSGTPYRIHVDTNMDLNIIAINFDLLASGHDIQTCIPLIPAEQYTQDNQLEALEIEDVPELNKNIVRTEAQALAPLFQYLVDAHHSAPQQQLLSNSLLQTILLSFCLPNSMEICGDSKKFSCQKILDYLYLHYDEDLNNAAIAQIFNYHPNYISQMFCEQMGCSLHRYLLNIRIQNALRLLQTTNAPICQIARDVGFCDVNYFSQYFKKVTGFPPSKYRAGL